MKPFDLMKAWAGAPVITHEGHEVKIVRIDWDQTYPVVADHKQPNMVGVLRGTYTMGGKASIHCECDGDLFMKEFQIYKAWVNVYPGMNYETKEIAASNAGTNAVATVEIEWED